MAHFISGFVADIDGLRRAGAGVPGARVAALSPGFGFLPAGDTAEDDMAAPFDQFDRLTVRLQVWAETASAAVPLVYLETDYFGVGSQSAVTWVNGRVVFGPARTETLWRDGVLFSTPLLDGAINRAVRLIGVARGSASDEFDALGLGRYRFNDGWLAAAR